MVASVALGLAALRLVQERLRTVVRVKVLKGGLVSVSPAVVGEGVAGVNPGFRGRTGWRGWCGAEWCWWVGGCLTGRRRWCL